MPDIIFETLPFRVYNYMLICTRFHVIERALSEFLNQKLVLLPDFFPKAITEDIVLENAVFLCVHLHGIIYTSRDRKKLRQLRGSLLRVYKQCFYVV